MQIEPLLVAARNNKFEGGFTQAAFDSARSYEQERKWRHLFTEDDIAFINEAVGEERMRFFGYEMERPGSAAARRTAGNRDRRGSTSCRNPRRRLGTRCSSWAGPKRCTAASTLPCCRRPGSRRSARRRRTCRHPRVRRYPRSPPFPPFPPGPPEASGTARGDSRSCPCRRRRLSLRLRRTRRLGRTRSCRCSPE